MNKIFQIGFNRCGTTSLYKFFQNSCTNNLKCIHWDDGNIAKTIFKNNINGDPPLHESKYFLYNFISDMEANIDDKIYYFAFLDSYKLLDTYYPNSKFILNTRNKKNWINSRLKHYNKKDIGLQKKTYNCNDIVKLWNYQWDYHHNNIISYFKNRQNDLLIFDIETTNAKPIIDFLPQFAFSTSNFPQKDYKKL